MTSIRFNLSAFIFSLVFLGANALAEVLKPIDSLTLKPTIERVSPFDIRNYFYPPAASNAYKRECEGETEYFTGSITLDDTNKIDVYRCVRWVRSGKGSSGTYKLRADDTRFHQVGAPYLTWISGNFIVEGKASLDEAYYPRLAWVGGDIIFHLENAVEYIDTPALKKAKKLEVYFRNNNVDLNGQNSITELTTLVLHNDVGGGNVLLNGLAKLEKLTTYQINGGGVLNPVVNADPADGGFLENLHTVFGNVSILADDMPRIYGMGNIQLVEGNLSISGENVISKIMDLTGLGNVHKVKGTLNIRSNDSLKSVDGLAVVPGESYLDLGGLSIEDNAQLQDLGGMSDVRVIGNGHVSILDNPSLSCNQINSFINVLSQRNPSISTTTPLGC